MVSARCQPSPPALRAPPPALKASPSALRTPAFTDVAARNNANNVPLTLHLSRRDVATGSCERLAIRRERPVRQARYRAWHASWHRLLLSELVLRALNGLCRSACRRAPLPTPPACYLPPPPGDPMPLTPAVVNSLSHFVSQRSLHLPLVVARTVLQLAPSVDPQLFQQPSQCEPKLQGATWSEYVRLRFGDFGYGTLIV